MTFLIILLVIFILLVVLLCLPLEILFYARLQQYIDLQVQLLYFFKLFHWRLPAESYNKKIDRETTSVQKGKSSSWFSNAYETIQVNDLWSKGWILLKHLAHSVKVKNLEGDVRFSAGDDYYTGMLSGMLLPLNLFLQKSMHAEISVQPVFEEDLILSGYIQGSFQLHPIRVIVPCLVFVCSSPVSQVRRIWMKK